MTFGPDATRYLLAGAGTRMGRPFHLRWLLPKVCGLDPRRWWSVWSASWVLLAGSMIWWRLAAGDDWRVAVVAAVLLCGLPGVLGSSKSIPVQVDLPATAINLFGCALWVAWSPVAAVAVFAVAAMISEKAPIIGALWLWSLWPLLALFPVIVVAVMVRTSPDPLGPVYQNIADHPIRTALEHHAGRWRDAWLMVAPWGICLVGLIGVDWRVLVVLAVAYAQLLVAGDTVRLVHHVAGVPMAVAAATIIPTNLLLLAVVAHTFWWRAPERI